MSTENKPGGRENMNEFADFENSLREDVEAVVGEKSQESITKFPDGQVVRGSEINNFSSENTPDKIADYFAEKFEMSEEEKDLFLKIIGLERRRAATQSNNADVTQTAILKGLDAVLNTSRHSENLTPEYLDVILAQMEERIRADKKLKIADANNKITAAKQNNARIKQILADKKETMAEKILKILYPEF